MAQVITAEANTKIREFCYGLYGYMQIVPQIPDTIFGEFKIVTLLGKGAFNEAYLGIHLYTRQEAAIKLELTNCGHNQLLHELEIYRKIGPYEEGFPIVYSYGENYYEPVSNKVFNYMCMERLGSSLGTLFASQKLKFSLKTTLMIGMQVLNRLEKLHSLGIIHRDIKPDNLLIGRETNSDSTTIHLIDFGMAIEYWDEKTNSHKPMLNTQRAVGTLRYSSINTHTGILQSRRDDLETLSYVLTYFLQGYLPWSGPFDENVSPTERHEFIHRTKSYCSPELLCKGLPTEFAMFLRYCRLLQYDETPNYNYLKGLLRQAAGNMSINLEDGIFDWTLRRTPWNN